MVANIKCLHDRPTVWDGGQKAASLHSVSRHFILSFIVRLGFAGADIIFIHSKKKPKVTPSVLFNAAGRVISAEEVAKHSSAENCWCTIHGVVYDLTSFLKSHPGGSAILIKYAGKDATRPFDVSGHPLDIVSKLGLEHLIVGKLDEAGSVLFLLLLLCA